MSWRLVSKFPFLAHRDSEGWGPGRSGYYWVKASWARNRTIYARYLWSLTRASAQRILDIQGNGVKTNFACHQDPPSQDSIGSRERTPFPTDGPSSFPAMPRFYPKLRGVTLKNGTLGPGRVNPIVGNCRCQSQCPWNWL